MVVSLSLAWRHTLFALFSNTSYAAVRRGPGSFPAPHLRPAGHRERSCPDALLKDLILAVECAVGWQLRLAAPPGSGPATAPGSRAGDERARSRVVSAGPFRRRPANAPRSWPRPSRPMAQLTCLCRPCPFPCPFAGLGPE